MTRNLSALWVSMLLIAGLVSSCGGDTVNDSLLAEAQGDGVFEEELAALEGMDIPEREVSYTPGLHCAVAPGFSNVDIFKYGWKAGNVVENAVPKWVRLITANNSQAKILYKFQETGSGRLKSVKVFGQGSRCN